MAFIPTIQGESGSSFEDAKEVGAFDTVVDGASRVGSSSPMPYTFVGGKWAPRRASTYR